MKRAVDRRAIKDANNKPHIKADLANLSLAPNQKSFEIGCDLFLKKWFSYFRSFWINRCENWYAGAGKRTPNDNNLLEGFNGNMKIHQTYYQRKGLAEFKVRLLNIVRERSQEYLMDKKPFKYDVTVTNRASKAGLAYARTKGILYRKQNDDSVFVYMRKGDSTDAVTDNEVDAFLNAEYEEFDDFVEHMFDFYTIRFDSNWKNSTCSCVAYAERFMCKHILCIAQGVEIRV